MTKGILVGIGGGKASASAAWWAARQAAARGVGLTLMTVVDIDQLRKYVAVDIEHTLSAAEAEIERLRGQLIEAHPGLAVSIEVLKGEAVEKLVDESVVYELVVLGSHRGRTLTDTFGGATAVRISASTSTPTAVIPFDWSEESQGEGILVAVGPDEVSSGAIDFAAQQALLWDQPLQLSAAWGLPPYLSRPAEAMGGGLGPVGEARQQELEDLADALCDRYDNLQVTGVAIECENPAKGIVEACEPFGMLVMGTHSRAVLGRLLFGSVTHGVLQNLRIPTVVVPKK